MSKTIENIKSRFYVLYVDESKESKLALKYLKEEGLDFQIRSHFGEHEKQLVLDVLDTVATLPILYDETVGFSRSITGIKNLVRAMVLAKLGIEYEHSIPKDLAFYTDWDYSIKPVKVTKVVTCFNKQGEKIYVGDIDKAPHHVKEPLNTHDYKSWHEVASWEIGDWNKISQKKDEKERIVDLEKKLILFPDDIEKLELGNVAVITDSRSIYDVTYEAYFKEANKLYKLYANMFD